MVTKKIVKNFFLLQIFFLALEIFVYIFSKFLGMSEMFKASLRNLFVAVNPYFISALFTESKILVDSKLVAQVV